MATYERTATVKVSEDNDTRKANEGIEVNVTFRYIDWTIEDMLDRLNVSNSPKVSVQAILRKMKSVPTEYVYNVPKAGTRGSGDPLTRLEGKTLTADQITRLQAILDAQEA